MQLLVRFIWFISKYLFSLILLSYTISFGVLTKKGRRFIVNVLDFYNFKFITKSYFTSLSKVSYCSLISNNKISIIEPIEKDGNITLEELAIINGIVKKNKLKRIFEIGTFNGRTTVNFSYNSEDSCEIFTLDLPKAQLGEAKYRISDYDKTLVNKEICGEKIKVIGLKYRKKIIQLYGDSATFDFTPFFNSCELVFIDGAHDYKNALNDSETALKLIGNNRGVILWHDYKDYMPVVKAIETFRQRHPDLRIYHIERTNLAYCT